MADPISMTQIIAKVRHLGGFETLDQANAFITDANIQERANANLRKVYLALVRARGHEYYREQFDFQTVKDQSSYPLDDIEMLELLGVSRQCGSEWEPLVDFNESERHDFDSWIGTRLGDPTRFQLQKNSIALQPTPQVDGQTIRIFYVPSFQDITADNDEPFDGVCGFEEWAVWETLAEFQAKDSADWTLSMMKAKWWADEVEMMAAQRNAAMPRRVQRVRRFRRCERLR